MAIEIIRVGRLPEEAWYEHTCPSCKTHYKFQRKDTRSGGDQRDPCYVIDCPFCSNQNYIFNLTSFRSRGIDPY